MKITANSRTIARSIMVINTDTLTVFDYAQKDNLTDYDYNCNVEYARLMSIRTGYENACNVVTLIHENAHYLFIERIFEHNTSNVDLNVISEHLATVERITSY